MLLLRKADRVLLAQNTLALIALTDALRQLVEPKHGDIWPEGELVNVIPIRRPTFDEPEPA